MVKVFDLLKHLDYCDTYLSFTKSNMTLANIKVLIGVLVLISSQAQL